MNAATAQVLGNTSLDHPDVLIIGSGPGGSAVAEMLCRHGQKVLMLEAGPNYFPGLDDPDPARLLNRFGADEIKLRRRWMITPDPLAEPRTIRSGPEDGERAFIGEFTDFAKAVGGAAVHADFKATRFMPQDFQLGRRLAPVPGASFVDWPVDYDQLEPFYVHAERMLGVQGLAGADPLAGPRSAPFPMPPGVPMLIGLRFAEAASRLGYHPFPMPAALNSRPYDGRPACVDCGHCSGHPCTLHAKGSPAVTLLRRALLSGRCQLWPETRAVRLRFSGSGDAVLGVEALLPDGSRRVFAADRYVLSAGPVEDVRLLLLSGDGAPPAAERSGALGRYLTQHVGLSAVGAFVDVLHGDRGRSSSHAFSDFRGVPEDPARPLGGVTIAISSQYPLQEALTYQQQLRVLGVRGVRLKKLLRQGRGRDRLVWLTCMGEDAPQPTNRVDLDPGVRDLDGLPVARITYKSHAWERAAAQHYTPKLMDLLQAMGARAGAVLEPGTGGHVMGTLRMGSDPQTSVVTPDGRFHGIGNLYAADGSLFPTASGFPPTLTITALAARVGAAMVFPQSPERGLP